MQYGKRPQRVNSYKLNIFITETTVMTIPKSRINKFLQTDFTKKVNVKNERRFDRPTVIFKFMIKSKISMCLYTIVKINEILTKSSKLFT